MVCQSNGKAFPSHVDEQGTILEKQCIIYSSLIKFSMTIGPPFRSAQLGQVQ